MRQRATVLAFFLLAAIGAVTSAHADGLWVSSFNSNLRMGYGITMP
jgi:hypothetical protein